MKEHLNHLSQVVNDNQYIQVASGYDINLQTKFEDSQLITTI